MRRIYAAVCPSSSLSIPESLTTVFFSTAAFTPSGSSNSLGVENPRWNTSSLPLSLGAVADADDLQHALEPLGDAGHHIGHQAAGEPLQRIGLLGLGDRDHPERSVLNA